jgi:hypothetical protein
MNFNVDRSAPIGIKPNVTGDFIGLVYSNVLESSLSYYLPLTGGTISSNLGIGSTVSSLNTAYSLNVNSYIVASSNITACSNIITSNINSTNINNFSLLNTGPLTFTNTLTQQNTGLITLRGVVSISSNISFNANSAIGGAPIANNGLIGGTGTRIILRNAKSQVEFPDAIGLAPDTVWLSSSNIAMYINGTNQFNINSNGVITTSNQINQIKSDVNNFFMGKVGIATSVASAYNLNVNGSLNSTSINVETLTVNGKDITSGIANTSFSSSNYASNISNVLNINSSNYASNISNILNINSSNYASNISNVLNVNSSNYASNISNIIIINSSNYASNISNILNINSSNYASNISNILNINSSNYASNISNVLNINSSNYASNISNVLNINSSNYASNISNILNINSSNYASNISNIIIRNSSNYASNISNVLNINSSNYASNISNIIIRNSSNYASNISNVLNINSSNYASNISNVLNINSSNYASNISNILNINSSNYASNISNIIIINSSNYASNISNIIIINSSNYASNISNVLNINSSNYASNISNVLLTNIYFNTSNYASNISNVLNINSSNYASNISNVLNINSSNYTTYVYNNLLSVISNTAINASSVNNSFTSNYIVNVSNILNSNSSNYASNISNILNINSSNYASNISNILNINSSNYASNISNVLNINSSNYASNISNVLLINISFNCSNYASNISNVLNINSSNYASNISNVLNINSSNYASNISNVLNINSSNYASNISNVLNRNSSNYASNISNVLNINSSNYASNISNVLLINISFNCSNYASNISNVLNRNSSNYASNISNVLNINSSNYASNISNVLLTNITANFMSKSGGTMAGNISINGTLTTSDTATIANSINISGATTSAQSLSFRGLEYNLGIAGTSGNYSTSALKDDMILRTIGGTNIILQCGIGTGALKITSGNDVNILNNLSVNGVISGNGSNITALDYNNITRNTLLFNSPLTQDVNNVVSFDLDNQTPTRFPPAAMTAFTTSFKSSSYKNNGTYIASSSTPNSFTCFDYNELTEWTATNTSYRSIAPFDYTSTAIASLTIINGTSNIYGEWVQLNYDKGFVATSITIVGVNANNIKCPSAFILAGSIDGSYWTFLSQQSGIKTFNTKNTFIINNYTKYNFYRTIFTNTIGSTELRITEIQFFGLLNASYTNNDNFNQIIYNTTEKQFPPRLYDSASAETTYTPVIGNELYGLNPATIFKQTLTLNNHGTYTIYSSSTYTSLFKNLLFNFNIAESEGAHWANNNYNGSGVSNTASCIKSDYTGDWIIVKLPYKIILTRFRFYIRSTATNRVPGSWKCYGSNDGISFTEITEAGNIQTNLTVANYTLNSLGYYETILPSIFDIPYLYIGWVIKQLVGGDTILNFSELQIFGKDDITNSYSKALTLTSDNKIIYNNISTITTYLGPTAVTGLSLANKYMRFNYEEEVYFNQRSTTSSITFTNGTHVINSIPAIRKTTYPILKDNNFNTIQPLVWYKFDDNVTNFLFDYGTLKNGNLTNNSVSQNIDINGVVPILRGNGNAYFGNGASTAYHFTVPTTMDLNAINITNGITFTLWVYIASNINGNGRIFDFGQRSGSPLTGSNYISISIYNTTQRLKFEINNASIGISTYLTDANYFTGWNNLTWTISKTGESTIYINGSVPAGTWYGGSTRIIPSIPLANRTYFIGKSLSSDHGYLNMYLDDFRIYGKVLSSTEVSELYTGRVEVYTKNNIGIGLTNPNTNYILDVNGNTNISGNFDVLGVANIHNGTRYAALNHNLNPGSLIIGSTGLNYGGGTLWNDGNAACLMMECDSNTEIAVHDNGTRLASLMYYEGNDINKITIGRDMGWQVLNNLQIGNAGRFRIGSNANDFSLIGTLDTDNNTTNTKIFINGNNCTHASAKGCIQYFATGDPGAHVFYNGGVGELMRIDRTGNITCKGTLYIGQNNSYPELRLGSTNGNNLGIATIAGGFSESAAVNDMVIRSLNRLILQKGGGVAAIIIDNNNYPTLRRMLGFCGADSTDDVAAANDLIFNKGAVMTGVWGGDLCISNYWGVSILLNAGGTANGNGGPANAGRTYDSGLSSFNVLMRNSGSSTFDKRLFTVRPSGVMMMCNDQWHITFDNVNRFYFAPNGTTFISGGGSSATNSLFVIYSSATTGNATIFSILNNGTTTIAGPLTVTGATTLNDTLTVGSYANNKYGYIGGLRIAGWDTGNTLYQETGDLGITVKGTTPKITFNCFGGNNIIMDIRNTSVNIYQPLNVSGNVGIGTASPNALLTIYGGTQVQTKLSLTGTEYYAVDGPLTSVNGIGLLLGVNRDNNRQLWICDTLQTPINNTNTVIRFMVGTETPSIDAVATDGRTRKSLILQPAGGGNLGIGLNPNYKLHITAGKTAASTAFAMKISGGVAIDSGNHGTLLGLGSEDGGFTKCAIGHVRTGPHDQGAIVFLNRETNDGTSCDMSNERMRIKSNGFVGIGTTDPQSHLQVSGLVNINNGSGVGLTYMQSGSLTIGGTTADYGCQYYPLAQLGGTNTAGLLMECLNNTEIVIHDQNDRLVSAIAYFGGGTNTLYIGRAMGWNSGATTPVNIPGNLTVGGIINTTTLQINSRSIYNNLFNSSGYDHSTITDFNAITDFGYRFITGPTNGPGTVSNPVNQYYSWFIGLGSSYNYDSYGAQFALPRNTPSPVLSVRYRDGSSSTSWGSWTGITAEALTSGNKTISGILTVQHSSSTFSAADGGLYVYNPSNTANSCSVLGARIGGSIASRVGISLDVSGVGGWSIYMNGSDTTDKCLRFNSTWNGVAGNERLLIKSDGTTTLNGALTINETTGTQASTNNGSLVFNHASGQASSIVFRSGVNPTSDYGYIQYQDNSSIGTAGESARLIIGTNNDGDDHIILLPSGGVGIGTNNPGTNKLQVNGTLTATSFSGPLTGNADTATTANNLNTTNNYTVNTLNANGDLLYKGYRQPLTINYYLVSNGINNWGHWIDYKGYSNLLVKIIVLGRYGEYVSNGIQTTESHTPIMVLNVGSLEYYLWGFTNQGNPGGTKVWWGNMAAGTKLHFTEIWY